MEVIQVENRNEWDQYLEECERNSFLQTWEWGEFQKSLGRKIERLAIFFNGKLVGLSLWILQSSRFEKYVYCPRGPLLVKDTVECYTQVLGALKEYWSKKNIGAIKIDPGFVENIDIAKVPKQLGFIHSINFVQSENNWMVDLVGENEDDLFMWCKEHGMSKNYPTYIRKARREGVEISFSKEKEDWDLFHTYLTISGRRKDFEVKSKKYYIDMWKNLGEKSDILRLGIAKKDGDILAMILIAVYGDEISVLYSAQTDTQTKLRATMLLRWECMLLGQKEGIKRFNNWGVLPEKKYKESNPGYGYSHYKRDFGGYIETIERTYEYAYNSIPHLLQRIYDWYIKIRYYRFR
jgi:lipid II:glycine glycyltransferase (peptidoglycan interpeptide bridge formation enzyme)